MNKKSELEKINKEIEHCKICKVDKIGVAVPGEGNPDAQVMFVGEAPGKQESVTGRPFIGRSGKLLRSMIREVGLREEEVYITSPVKYLPAHGTPRPNEIAHGRIHFDQQLKVIDPKIVVLLGNVAIQAALGEKLSVMKEHGRIIERDGRNYFITLHPAAGLRFPPLKKLIQEDFVKLKKLLSA